jgi:hypothetical protein
MKLDLFIEVWKFIIKMVSVNLHLTYMVMKNSSRLIMLFFDFHLKESFLRLNISDMVFLNKIHISRLNENFVYV